MLLEAISEIFEIEQPLAQIGVADLHHARARLITDLLYCRLGGQAAADRIGDARDPAAVLREHAVGLKYVAMLTGAEPAARSDKLVNRIAHRRDPVAQALELSLDVLGDQLTDQQPGLVQNGRCDRQAGIEPNADESERQ
jgi:hypothetical protein